MSDAHLSVHLANGAVHTEERFKAAVGFRFSTQEKAAAHHVSHQHTEAPDANATPKEEVHDDQGDARVRHHTSPTPHQCLELSLECTPRAKNAGHARRLVIEALT